VALRTGATSLLESDTWLMGSQGDYALGWAKRSQTKYGRETEYSRSS
jgi:hypothetical protein